jgi:tetratricopeptide (TPR) repeat protein
MSQFQTAHDAYRDARALVPSDGRAVEGLARMQAALKRLDAEREKATAAARALQLVEEAGRKLEAAERLLYDRGSTIEEIVRRAEEARDVASRADLPQARRIAGRAILLKGDEAGAEAEFRKAGDTARLDLARLLVLRVYAASVGVSDAEREARRPERNRLAAEAERVLVGAVVENDLDRVLVRGMLAFVTMKEMEAARADLSAALGRFGESAGTEYLHWIAAVMAPKASKRAHVEVALRIRPKFPEALFVRAALRTDAGELGGAVEDCDALLELRPDHLDGLFNRGVARLRQRDFAKAEADFTRVIELDPRGAEGHYKRGLCRHARKDAAGAVADFTAAIERDPGHRWALAWRAVSRVDSGSYTDGEADADACLAIEGGNTIALSARGRARLARGAKEAAAADFYVAGTIVAEKGDHAGAVLLYSDAVGAHPSPSVHAARALSRTRLDDRKGAIEDYRRSLEIAPADWPLREKVEKILRSLESE